MNEAILAFLRAFYAWRDAEGWNNPEMDAVNDVVEQLEGTLAKTKAAKALLAFVVAFRIWQEFDVYDNGHWDYVIDAVAKLEKTLPADKVRALQLEIFGLEEEVAKSPPEIVDSCTIIERTGDGVSVGRCWFYCPNGVCPRHGDVTKYLGKLTDENELRKDRGLPPLGVKNHGNENG